MEVKRITHLPEDHIFVFGSNLAGRHGKGAALDAVKFFGAKYGVAIGRTGQAYAIPTKDRKLKTLSLEQIEHFVEELCIYAEDNSKLTFVLTEIGCGLAGYTPEQIAPLFKYHPKNILLPKSFKEHI